VTQLPETIGYLRCLRALDVSNNIIHALPESLSLLRNLRVLDLRRNVLRALPIGLGSLVDLETIEVGVVSVECTVGVGCLDIGRERCFLLGTLVG